MTKILLNKPNINKKIVAEAQMLIDEQWKPDNKIVKDKKLREAMAREYARRLRLDILSTYKPSQIKKYLTTKRIKLLGVGKSSGDKWKTITPVLNDLSWKELEKILSRGRKKTYRRKRRKKRTRRRKKKL